MIYRHARYLSALNFVLLFMDNVDLVDLVCDDETKKIWHCADLQKSIMPQQAIIVACNDVDGKKEKSKIPVIFVQSQIRNIENEALHKLQFLGLVSLFTNQLSDSVISFKLHSFLVYDYDEENCFTKIQALVTDTH